MNIPVAAALEAIQREGAFVLEDSNIGEQVSNFDKEIKTPDGFNFLARNSLDNPEILRITQSLLTQPYWAFVKFYSDILPSEYAFSFHTGRTIVALAIQLWSPGSTFALLERSHLHNLKEGDVDKEVSNEWGLLAARLNLPEVKHTLEQGGL
ncbi:hypothetical protein BHE90_016942 [Fusarium euwallaceae]|uniref:Uncharacterized protein n=1 Tax=Fusarium euwallaceae TaxID=1147111 RepID=A0A430KYZ1_9HYPO|nr:hypothetical protein BHE90_016942 [Fusarium euwallaceae]